MKTVRSPLWRVSSAARLSSAQILVVFLELITDGVDGRLFTSRDSKQLASIIRELWNNPEETDNYAKACLNLEQEMTLRLTATNSSRFIWGVTLCKYQRMDYALYFGRFSEEKGIGTLIKVCKELPDVQFIFAGTGPLEDTINGVKATSRM